MGIILFLTATILSIFLYPLGLIYIFIKWSTLFRFKSAIKHRDDIFFMCAVLIDVMGNVFMKHIFNDLLIKKGGLEFGDPTKTISYVLGYNKHYKNLTKTGVFVANMLNFIEKEHVEKAYKGGF